MEMMLQEQLETLYKRLEAAANAVDPKRIMVAPGKVENKGQILSVSCFVDSDFCNCCGNMRKPMYLCADRTEFLTEFKNMDKFRFHATIDEMVADFNSELERRKIKVQI